MHASAPDMETNMFPEKQGSCAPAHTQSPSQERSTQETAKHIATEAEKRTAEATNNADEKLAKAIEAATVALTAANAAKDAAALEEDATMDSKVSTSVADQYYGDHGCKSSIVQEANELYSSTLAELSQYSSGTSPHSNSHAIRDLSHALTRADAHVNGVTAATEACYAALESLRYCSMQRNKRKDHEAEVKEDRNALVDYMNGAAGSKKTRITKSIKYALSQADVMETTLILCIFGFSAEHVCSVRFF